MDHIDDMDQLRQGIGLQAYGQRDPLVEYKTVSYTHLWNDAVFLQITGSHPRIHRSWWKWNRD